MRIKVKGVEVTMKKLSAELRRAELQKDAVVHSVANRLAAATPVDTGRAAAGWHIAHGDIVNNVPYIEQLNNGSSAQAPEHFVEKTVLSTPGLKVRGTIVTIT